MMSRFFARHYVDGVRVCDNKSWEVMPRARVAPGKEPVHSQMWPGRRLHQAPMDLETAHVIADGLNAGTITPEEVMEADA